MVEACSQYKNKCGAKHRTVYAILLCVCVVFLVADMCSFITPLDLVSFS